jgi:hypothetical protein
MLGPKTVEPSLTVAYVDETPVPLAGFI